MSNDQMELWPEIAELEREYREQQRAIIYLPYPLLDDPEEWNRQYVQLNSFSQFLAERNARMQGESKEPI